MKRKQLFALFVCSLIPAAIGNGLLPIQPLYARGLGATPAFVGAYLSFSYLALAVGTMLGGWLADRFQRRKLQLIAFSVLNIPTLVLMGQVTNAWQLAALTAFIWLSATVGGATVSILAGLLAAPEERGRVFGILAMTPALGALIGGSTVGPIVDAWGYGVLFAILGLIYALLPLAALLLEEPPAVARAVAAGAASEKAAPLGSAFFLFMAAGIIAGITLFVGRLGTSVTMSGLGFLAAALSSTAAIGGLVTLPLTFSIGRLSDRVGRRMLLALSYSGGAAGVLMLVVATSLWQFWVAATLLSISSYVGSGVGSALVADMVPREALGRGMSLFQTTSWVGGIIGFAAAGLAIESFGGPVTFVVAGMLQLAALTLLVPGAKAAPAALGGS